MRAWENGYLSLRILEKVFLFLAKLIRKPVGVGAEYKCMADAWSGIMLFLEYQEAKDRMQLKKWCDQYPKHVALVPRLTEMLHGKVHIVYGDSYFTSVQTVKALLEHGTYYLGMLKTASAGFISCHLHGMMMPHKGRHVQFNTQ